MLIMADHAIVIDDEYIVDVGRHCKNRGRNLEDILVDYIGILEEIRKEAIIDGEIAFALSDYIECVKMLREHMTTISDNVKTVAYNFVAAVDEADAFLF